MFLQSKYQKQFQQEAYSTFGGTLGFQNFKKESKTKPAMAGSVKMGRIEFERGEQIFPREDMPLKAVTAKKEMEVLVDSDILGLRKKEWNGSSFVPKNNQEEDFDRKLTKIKAGFFDTPIHKYTPPKIEPGTDLRNNYRGWNVSTEVISPYYKQRSLELQTQHSMEKTLTIARSLKDYKTPQELTKTYNDNLRQTKRDEKELKTQLRQTYRFHNPSATEENINAGVQRMVYEMKMRSLSPTLEDPMNNDTFKPDLSKTLKKTVSYYAYHNGSWGKHSLAKDKEVWSCCMMEKKTGEGCVTVKVNPNKWILNAGGSAF